KRDRSHHIDPQNLWGRDWHRKANEDDHRDNQSLSHVGRQHKQDCFFDVVVDRAAFFDRGRNRGKVIIREDHTCGLLGHLGAFDAHGDAYIGLLQRWRVVYAITRHRYDLLVGLNGFHEPEFVFGACTREHVDVAHFLLECGSTHLFDLGPGDRGLAVTDAEHL